MTESNHNLNVQKNQVSLNFQNVQQSDILVVDLCLMSVMRQLLSAETESRALLSAVKCRAVTKKECACFTSISLLSERASNTATVCSPVPVANSLPSSLQKRQVNNNQYNKSIASMVNVTMAVEKKSENSIEQSQTSVLKHCDDSICALQWPVQLASSTPRH